MYLDFYKLKERPFNMTPDPRFLYFSGTHQEALANLTYGIESHKGFICISGEVGTGKTLILHTLLRQLSPDTEVAFIYLPSMSFAEVLRYILQEWDQEPRADGEAGLLTQLNDFLIERCRQGKTCVLVVDEAQNMPVETLERIRMLSNLETADDKLLQIVLVGQSELDRMLEEQRLRQLRQRIALRYHLRSLQRHEVLGYIAHRLEVAGALTKKVFTKAALDEIVVHSRGIPRLINVICDNAFLVGFAKGENPVSRDSVREVLRDFSGAAVQPRRRRLRWAAAVGVVVLAAGAAVWRWSPSVWWHSWEQISVPDDSVPARQEAPPQPKAARVGQPEKVAERTIVAAERPDDPKRVLVEPGGILGFPSLREDEEEVPATGKRPETVPALALNSDEGGKRIPPPEPAPEAQPARTTGDFGVQAASFQEEWRTQLCLEQLAQLGYQGIVLPTPGSSWLRVVVPDLGSRDQAQTLLGLLMERSEFKNGKPFIFGAKDPGAESTSGSPPHVKEEKGNE